MEAQVPCGRQAAAGRGRRGQPAARRGGPRDSAPGRCEATGCPAGRAGPGLARGAAGGARASDRSGRVRRARSRSPSGGAWEVAGVWRPCSAPRGPSPSTASRPRSGVPRREPPGTEREREPEGARARKGSCGVRRSQRGGSRHAEARSRRARRGEGTKAPTAGGVPGPRRAAPAAGQHLRPRGSAGQEERQERLRRRPVRHRPSTRRRLPVDAGAGRNWSEGETPPPHTPRPGGSGMGKVCPVLTEDAVFLQGAVDLAVGVDLEMVLGGTVEFPPPGRSPEVFVDAAAAPRIPARPGVARGGSGGLGHPRGPPWGPRLLQQTQEQDPNYNHCGMMAAALSLRGRWRLGANDTRGPIKAVLLAALQSCRAHTGSSREASASFYQPRSGPFICLRFT